MRWTCNVALRRGSGAPMLATVRGSSRPEVMHEMDEWVRTNASPGDVVKWTCEGGDDVGAGQYGGYVVQPA